MTLTTPTSLGRKKAASFLNSQVAAEAALCALDRDAVEPVGDDLDKWRELIEA